MDVFFSPPSFPRALNQKKDGCGGQNPQDTKIPRIPKSPGYQNPQDDKIPGTAKSREIPGMKC